MAPRALDKRVRGVHFLALAATSATVVFIAIAYLALLVSRVAPFDATQSLRYLSLGLAVLTLLLGWTIAEAFEQLQWALIGRAKGASAATVLALSPTTTLKGMWTLLTSGASRSRDKLWVIIRMVLLVMIGVANVVLFSNASITTAYVATRSYDVMAGVGRFNGSMVRPYIQKQQSIQSDYKLKIMPYPTQAMLYNLISNSVHATSVEPVECKGSGCESYLFTGGLYLSTPWAPTDRLDSPVVQIENIIGRQVEFKTIQSSNVTFAEDDCALYHDNGTTIVAIKLCIARSRSRENSIQAGLYICPNGAQDGACDSSTSFPGLGTEFSIHERLSTIVVSRANFSIVSASNLGHPILDAMPDLASFRQALDWLLDFAPAGIPAPTSVVSIFWNGQEQLKNDFWNRELRTAFYSVLAFPLWMFQPNNFGNVDLAVHEINPGLPAELYTTARIAKLYTKIVIDEAILAVFIGLECAILVFIWIIAIWLVLRTSPNTLAETSSFPLLDFVMKTKSSGFATFRQDPLNAKAPPADVLKADDREILELFGPLGRIVLSSVDTPEREPSLPERSLNPRCSSEVTSLMNEAPTAGLQRATGTMTCDCTALDSMACRNAGEETENNAAIVSSMVLMRNALPSATW